MIIISQPRLLETLLPLQILGIHVTILLFTGTLLNIQLCRIMIDPFTITVNCECDTFLF